jgi:hypothetical protein
MDPSRVDTALLTAMATAQRDHTGAPGSSRSGSGLRRKPKMIAVAGKHFPRICGQRMNDGYLDRGCPTSFLDPIRA